MARMDEGSEEAVILGANLGLNQDLQVILFCPVC